MLDTKGLRKYNYKIRYFTKSTSNLLCGEEEIRKKNKRLKKIKF